MITKEELKEMIIEQLNEMELGLTGDLETPDLVMARGQKAERINPLVTYLEKAGFAREVIAGMVKKFEALDDHAVAAANAAIKTKKHKELFSILRQSAGEVDPLADTVSTDPLARTTVKTPTLRRENKIITQSRLRQLIKEELEVILTDDEVKEMFGIDITEEKEGSVKIKI